MNEDDLNKNAELKKALEDIKDGRRPPKGLFDTIHEFGDEEFTEAAPIIEKFLTNADPRLRYISLHVLTMHFRLQKYWKVAVQMLENDPDEDCRIMAISALRSLKRNTSDRETLTILVRLIRDEQEQKYVRESAYRAMRGIIAYNNVEQLNMATGDFDWDKDVDWDMVNSYS